MCCDCDVLVQVCRRCGRTEKDVVNNGCQLRALPDVHPLSWARRGGDQMPAGGTSDDRYSRGSYGPH